ncbi:uncharacterized protein MCYG_08064 [Microsporum canis CBS 113480]|uniref:Uncharacterized protein n=1 Tax=Arthroderma otae (strain ATCC MYA-4605 / CBS 113480) TaxID=554155 RepID=C5FZE2_ARTOC|nr:uncharacterized protein MCYG_08064 [Microsporum canis CBS 113480]EEQ35245.1 predicted protein [Microsporum canis CBS 113480]
MAVGKAMHQTIASLRVPQQGCVRPPSSDQNDMNTAKTPSRPWSSREGETGPCLPMPDAVSVTSSAPMLGSALDGLKAREVASASRAHPAWWSNYVFGLAPGSRDGPGMKLHGASYIPKIYLSLFYESLKELMAVEDENDGQARVTCRR